MLPRRTGQAGQPSQGAGGGGGGEGTPPPTILVLQANGARRATTQRCRENAAGQGGWVAHRRWRRPRRHAPRRRRPHRHSAIQGYRHAPRVCCTHGTCESATGISVGIRNSVRRSPWDFWGSLLLRQPQHPCDSHAPYS